MDAEQTSRPLARIATVVGALVVFVGGFGYFWTQVGGPMPGIVEGNDYEVSFRSTDVKNLQESGDVSIAGVIVGEVAALQRDGDRTRVTVDLSPEAAPLHEGVKVRIGVKSVVGQSYVDIQDGDGKAISDAAKLPDSAVTPSVDVDELISTLDPATRKALRGTIRSLGSATEGTADYTSQLMSGLGKLGREGHTALDAIAAQSDDLESLTREATTLLNTLDTGRGQIVDVVRDASKLTEATAGQRAALENTMRAMPRLLDSARTSTGRLGELSRSLSPIAADLRRAAPDLNAALLQMPAVTSDLRGLLPALDGTLDAAPATLNRVRPFSLDVRKLVPEAELLLRDVNPMLAYLKPYGRDFGSMFANFGASMDVQVENGVRPVRLAPIFNSGSIRGNPLPLNMDPTHWNNPYPEPGQAGNPAPFRGEYPRVERAPK